MPHEAEIQEARSTIDRLKEARSSIQSVLSGNRGVLNEAGYGSLVSDADSFIGRLNGAIDAARSFIENNEGGHPEPPSPQPPEDPVPVPSPDPPSPQPPEDPAPVPGPQPPQNPDPGGPITLPGGGVQILGSHST